MCFQIEKTKTNIFDFDNFQYSIEVAIMKKRIEKLNKKIELSKKILK